MKRWGTRVAERTNILQGWDVFDDVETRRATAVLPSPSTSLADEVLGEIDGLLAERDFLIGFWQAPGE